MKITNRTHYDTRAIRRVLTATHNELARAGEGRLPLWMHTRFYIDYANQLRGCSGRASIRGSWAKLWLIRHPWTDGDIQQVVGNMAGIAWHEMLHLHGYRHDVMGGKYGGRPNAEQLVRIVLAAGFDLATDPLPLLAPPAPKPKPKGTELQLLRYERVLAREVAWQRKLRRAQGALRKVRTQRRYYEGELAAKDALPKEAP